MADLRKEEPLLPHSSKTHVKADYAHCESRGDVEGGFFFLFFSRLEGVFSWLEYSYRAAARDVKRQPTRGKCEAELPEGEDIYPAVVFGILWFLGWQKWGENFSFSSSLSCV